MPFTFTIHLTSPHRPRWFPRTDPVDTTLAKRSMILRRPFAGNCWGSPGPMQLSSPPIILVVETSVYLHRLTDITPYLIASCRRRAVRLTSTENPREDGLPRSSSQGEQTLVSTYELVALAYPDCISRISSVPGSHLHVEWHRGVEVMGQRWASTWSRSTIYVLRGSRLASRLARATK
jgi:hypothetical protein